MSNEESTLISNENGAGKSTLGYALMGNPKYQITGGKILFEGKDISEETPDKRAKDPQRRRTAHWKENPFLCI